MKYDAVQARRKVVEFLQSMMAGLHVHKEVTETLQLGGHSVSFQDTTDGLSEDTNAARRNG